MIDDGILPSAIIYNVDIVSNDWYVYISMSTLFFHFGVRYEYSWCNSKSMCIWHGVI